MTTTTGPARPAGSLPFSVRDEHATERTAPPGSKFWDRRAKAYDDRARKRSAMYQTRIRNITSLLKESDVVLDVGCATGEITLDIAPQVRQVHGIDLSKNMIALANAKARERQVDNVRFSRTDVFDPRFARHAFSAITAFNIFHLLDDTPTVVDRLHELLVPGGLLISETPCLGERSGIMRSLIRLAVAVGFAPMIRELTIADLESLVSGRGFRMLETTTWDQKSAVYRIVARKW